MLSMFFHRITRTSATEILEWPWRQRSQAANALAYDCAGGLRDNDAVGDPVDVEGLIGGTGRRCRNDSHVSRVDSISIIYLQ
jgi:hypothetical protein